MQIFIPYPDVRLSLEALDNKRLGSQRREAGTVIRMFEQPIRPNRHGNLRELPWLNSPLAKMWRPYVPFLKLYFNTALEVWANRGYKNIILQPYNIDDPIALPAWWGSSVHLAHQAMLFRKNPAFYLQWWSVNDEGLSIYVQ